MFLGIDGGGTTTAVVLLAADGGLLARVAGGSTYHPQVGINGVREVLADGVAAVLRYMLIQGLN